jgi:hypothetical protein
MPLCRTALLVAGFIALAAPAPAQVRATAPHLIVGATQFQALRWMAGTWRAESDSAATAYVRYRFLDDSTLLVERAADRRFSGAVTRERYELRKNRFATRAAPRWVATAFDSTSVSFQRSTRGANSLIWRKLGLDEWLSVLTAPPTVDAPARVVTSRMTRVR